VGGSSLQPQAPPPALAEDEQGRTRLPWKSDGYSYWTWNGHRVHYVAVETEGARAQADKPPIVLIHGAWVNWFVGSLVGWMVGWLVGRWLIYYPHINRLWRLRFPLALQHPRTR
jgi:hypothetical protein